MLLSLCGNSADDDSSPVFCQKYRGGGRRPEGLKKESNWYSSPGFCQEDRGGGRRPEGLKIF